MYILDFRILLIVAIQLKCYSKGIDFDEACYLEEPPGLQVGFVMDYTGTFLNGNPSFFNEFAALAPKLLNAIDRDYPGSEFGLTLQGDWTWRAKPPHADPKYNTLHTSEDGCYWIRTWFTTNKTWFKENLRTDNGLGSGEQENGLSALAFTAADTGIGWKRNMTKFDNGKSVRRVLILVTDEDDLLLLKAPGTRKEFRGDGSDTCQKSKPPTHEKLREIFEKDQFTVISLLAENSARPGLSELYNEHFKKIGGTVKYCSRSFVLNKGRMLFTDEELKDKNSKDFWSGDNFAKEAQTLEKPSEKTPLQGRTAEIEELSARRAKAGQYDDLIKYVLDCLKETDSNACIFGDPPGFNTLGF